MKKIALLLFFILAFLVFPSRVQAIYDPLSVANNKFGIHILDTSDLNDAATLVNTNGDWGYVTLVITKTERDTKRWQQVFDRMRGLHLIPIVRVATRFDGVNWEKPNYDELDGWISFLDSLNWVIENRYVIVGNEPNHKSEWGGEIKPDEYAKWLKTVSLRLKASSSDYFILSAGLDASANDSRKYMDTMNESTYLKKMVESDSTVFDFVDGWTSHSYPNPNFSGSEDASGKGSIKSYIWEESFLKSLGVNKKLPVFITETGWVHKLNEKDKRALNPEEVSPKITTAFEKVWTEDNIVAITPFVLSYLDTPFEGFSWKDRNGGYFDFYTKVKDLPKALGFPIQKTDGEIVGVVVPPIVEIGSNVNGILIVKNNGQSIWNEGNLLVSDGKALKVTEVKLSTIEPGQVGVIKFKAEARDEAFSGYDNVFLTYKGTRFGNHGEFYLLTVSPAKLKPLGFFDKILKLFKEFKGLP